MLYSMKTLQDMLWIIPDLISSAGGTEMETSCHMHVMQEGPSKATLWLTKLEVVNDLVKSFIMNSGKPLQEKSSVDW